MQRRSDGDVCRFCGEIRFVHCPTEPNGLLPKHREIDGRLVPLHCPGFEIVEPEKRAA